MRQLDEKPSLIKGHHSSQVPTDLKVKCPHCFQVFTAFPREFEEKCPHFQCSVCQGQFWIDFPTNRQTDYTVKNPILLSTSTQSDRTLSFEEIILGHSLSVRKPIDPLSANRLGLSVKMCPKCSQEVSISEPNCPFCGVVFIKMIEGVEASFYLRGVWAKVLRYWHDEDQHDRFLMACRKENDLMYGISCYGRVLKEDKDNQKAREMIKRIEAFTWFFEEETISFVTYVKRFFLKIKKTIQSYAFDALMLTVVLFLFTFVFFIV